MPIATGNVKLVKSAIMDDVPEGGGAATATEIVGGVSNDIFDDISELDRAIGRVNLRLTYVNVDSPDTDKYLGANVIVRNIPQDANVSCTLFSTGNSFENRDAAKSRLESYLARGGIYPGSLLGTHLQGTQVLTVYQRTEIALPEIGQVVELVDNPGDPAEFNQFVRISSYDDTIQVFTVNVNNSLVDITRRVLTINISDPLRFDFDGGDVQATDGIANHPSVLYNTVVANAAKYYGTKPLTVAATTGDTQFQVSSMFEQLVPSTQSEAAYLDQLPTVLAPLQLTAVRKIELSQYAHSDRLKVKFANQQFNYVFQLLPKPSPGSISCSYRSQGRWYSVSDDGAGNLVGVGAGTVSYVTGSLNLTCEALPDVNSAIIVNWGDTAAMIDRSATDVTAEKAMVVLQLDHSDIEPGTLTCTWLSNAVGKSITVDAYGNITGDATGKVSFAAGFIRLEPNAFPDAGTEFTINYSYGAKVTDTLTGLIPDAGGVVTATTTQAIEPGTMECEWLVNCSTTKSSGASATQSAGSSSNISASVSIPGGFEWKTVTKKVEPTPQISQLPYRYGGGGGISNPG